MTEGIRATPEFDRAAYDRLKLPRLLGESIAAWDDPEFVPGADASFMRPDDYVLGVEVEGRARTYPLWLIDYYHVVNNKIDDRRFFVTSCERCGSGSAFVADPPGVEAREPLFRAGGLLNAALILRDVRSGSHWLHYEGRGLDRRATGRRLASIPVYHMEWADWSALHPDAEVWKPPQNPHHPDPRHGHGREEFFGRPGMEPAILDTMTRPLDDRYAESEMVLGVDDGDRSAAYPIREVHREGGTVHDTLPQGRIVVFAGPRPDGITMAAFLADLDGRALTFRRRDGGFVDAETGTRWTIEGRAVDGPLRGSRLIPVRWFYVRWQSWAAWHPGTSLYRSDRRPPRYGERPQDVDMPPLDPLLSTLVDAGLDIAVAGPVPTQRRPRRSRSSIGILIDGEPLIAHAFETTTAARDYEALRGAWSSLPLRPRALETRVRRLDRYVLEATPEKRFVDAAQIVPVPWATVRWPAVLEDPVLDRVAATLPPSADPVVEVGLIDIVRALRVAGFDVIDVGFLPPGQLRVGTVDAMALTVNADRFLLYLFEDETAADAYASEERHARAFERFVVRSTPDTMYVHQYYEIRYAGDERIAWSPLLSDPRFTSVLAATAIGVKPDPDREILDAASRMAHTGDSVHTQEPPRAVSIGTGTKGTGT